MAAYGESYRRLPILGSIRILSSRLGLDSGLIRLDKRKWNDLFSMGISALWDLDIQTTVDPFGTWLACGFGTESSWF